jgi:Na+/glutamate symporter
MRANNKNTNKNDNSRAIASVTAGISAGILAGITTDRIISRNQSNTQTSDIIERTSTTGQADITNLSGNITRTTEMVTMPQRALFSLNRRVTQTSKTVEASAFSPATQETQNVYEEETKVNLPLSTSGLAVGAMVGMAVGLATNYFLKEDDKPKTNTVIEPQEATATSQLSEEEQ